MAEKYYLDEEGLRRLVDFIKAQLIPVQQNTDAIELLNKTDGTPGSIQYMIDDVVSNLDITDLQQEMPMRIYGGSASDLIEGVQ